MGKYLVILKKIYQITNRRTDKENKQENKMKFLMEPNNFKRILNEGKSQKITEDDLKSNYETIRRQ